MDFADILAVAASQSRGGSSGGGAPAELLVNTGFDSGASWTLAGAGASIAGGKLQLGGAVNNTATQTLAGGSVAAGNYVVILDVDAIVLDDVTDIRLVGAGGETRGNQVIPGTGAAQVFPITAIGEVTSFRLFTAPDASATIDNVSLKAAA